MGIGKECCSEIRQLGDQRLNGDQSIQDLIVNLGLVKDSDELKVLRSHTKAVVKLLMLRSWKVICQYATVAA